MDLNQIKKIEKSDFYIDKAFRKASKKVKAKKFTYRLQIDKQRAIELVRIDILKNTLRSDLSNITKSFPNFDELSTFYKELIRCYIDYGDLKRSLGAVQWAKTKIISFSKLYAQKIKRQPRPIGVQKLRKEYYGRINSVLKQIDKNLQFLDQARNIFRKFPEIKDMTTVCLFGFPNVGKSTLLKKLTGADPEIKSYAFTTKRLNLGYIKEPLNKVQIIDTPGTLNRIDKMNNIELQAYLALRHLADLVVYVFDPTMPYETQEKLFTRVKKTKKKYLIYLSKTDLDVDLTPYKKHKEIIKNPLVLTKRIKDALN